MKYFYIVLLLLISFSAEMIAESRIIPDWIVDASDYEYNASIIARVYINEVLQEDSSSILGAFFLDECRGVADPVPFEDGLLFFMTIYSNQINQEIVFQFYHAENDITLDIQETIDFQANHVYGSVLEPMDLHGYYNYDHPPYLSDIPDQSITFSSTFENINLNEYLTELDGDQILWTVDGDENLQITITEGLAVVIRPDQNWTGSESIIFTATDQTETALSATDIVVLTVFPEDHPPQLLDIPDQCKPLAQNFDTIDLEQYLIEIDNDQVGWSYTIAENSNPQPVPEWVVDPSSFEASMTLTIEVYADGFAAEGEGHILGAFIGDECRGLASALMGIENWVYFLTVYADSPDEVISYKFYDVSEQKEMSVAEETPFILDGVIGNPLNPYTLHAGNLSININASNQVEIMPVSETWFGTETVMFTVTDIGTQEELSAFDEVDFTILNDHAPQILPIPDQVITTGDEFEQIILNEYLLELDGDEIEWSFTPPSFLNVEMIEGIVSINPFFPGWLGSEVITFTATDLTDFGASSSTEVVFTLLEIDHPPIVEGIPDQNIAIGMQFETVYLNNYLQELDGDQTQWSCYFPPEEIPEIIPDWNINPCNYELSINLVCVVESESTFPEGSSHLLYAIYQDECRGVSSAIYSMDKWLYYITIYADDEQDMISFKFYDSSKGRLLPVQQEISFGNVQNYGNPVEPVLLQAGKLIVNIDDDSIANIMITESDWFGSSTIHFIAEDISTMGNLSDYDEVCLSIIDDHAPQILTIENQTIMINQEFNSFNLDDYLNELDGDPVAWSWAGNENLQVSMDEFHTVIIDPVLDDWTGSEIITYTVQDNTPFAAWNSQDVVYTVLSEDHPPEVSDIPNQSICGEINFSSINLNEYLNELDGDVVVWNYEFVENGNTFPSPEWQVDPTDYQYTMNVTAEVNSKGVCPAGEQHILAAFCGDECRGTAYAIYSIDKWLYFLTVYSNSEDEDICLKFYDTGYMQILPTDSCITFQNNAVIGNPLVPLQVYAGFLKIEIDEQIAQVARIDQAWLGSEIVDFIAEDYNTTQHLTGQDQVVFSVTSQPEFILPESFSFDQDNVLQVDFSNYLNTSVNDYELNASESQSIIIDIDDFMVAFSAISGWSGSEMITFTVTDLASRTIMQDSVEVIVVPVGDITVTKDFSSGWNWISLNINQDDMTLNNVFGSIGNSGSRVKSQTNSAMYYPGVGWLGSLLEINNESLYKLSCNQDCVWEFSGVPIDIQETTYSLDAGWNWISFAPQVSEELNYAFTSLSNGIGVKNQTQSALFYGGSIWLGSLMDLYPLEGYMLNMAAEEEFNFPQPSSREISAKETKEFCVPDAGWCVDYRNYEYNSSMIIELTSSEKEFDPNEFSLGIFSDDECRGIANHTNNAILDYTAIFDKVYHMPMIYSNSPTGEEMEIIAFHLPSAKIIKTNYIFTFNEELIAGSWENPIQIKLSQNSNYGNEKLQKPACYPNPFNPSTSIRFEIDEPSNVTLDIFNIKGQKVNTIFYPDMEAGSQSIIWQGADYKGDECSSGIYFFRLKSNNQIQSCRALLLK